MTLVDASRMFFLCYFFSSLLSFLINRKLTKKFAFGLSLRLPLVYLKVKRKMDPIFEHSVFDSARENKKRFIRQLEKSEEAFENLL